MAGASASRSALRRRRAKMRISSASASGRSAPLRRATSRWFTGTKPCAARKARRPPRGRGRPCAGRVGRQLVAEDRRVQFAAAQHGEHVGAWPAPLRPGRVAVLGDVRVLEGHPAHRVGSQPVAVLQRRRAATSRSSGCRPARRRAGPRGPSGRDAAVGAAQQRALLEARGEHHGQQRQGLAGRLRHQEGGDRHLADVVAPLAHHRREGSADDGHRREVEPQPRGGDGGA